MQHTEKYQFNLIEGSDSFLPEPLNDNMRKLDSMLAAHSLISEPLREAELEQAASTFTLSVEGLELHRFQYVLVDVLTPEDYSGGHSYFTMQLNDQKVYNLLNGLYESTVDYIGSGKIIPCSYARPRIRMVLAAYRDPDAFVDGVLLNQGRVCGSKVRVSELTSLRLCVRQDDPPIPAGTRIVIRGVR